MLPAGTEVTEQLQLVPGPEGKPTAGQIERARLWLIHWKATLHEAAARNRF